MPTTTDIFSGWTEVRAIWGKNSRQVVNAISEIEGILPFKIRGFASDSGCEFRNKDLLKYFNCRPCPIPFVRGRPNIKNDNAHVEQKNWTHVRQLLGYSRLDRRNDVDFINDLYVNYWLILWNYFTPVMKVSSKTQIGRRVVRTYDKPKTPCDRLLESGSLSDEQKQVLMAKIKGLNPFELRAELNRKLSWYFKNIGIRDKHLFSPIAGVANY